MAVTGVLAGVAAAAHVTPPGGSGCLASSFGIVLAFALEHAGEAMFFLRVGCLENVGRTETQKTCINQKKGNACESFSVQGLELCNNYNSNDKYYDYNSC